MSMMLAQMGHSRESMFHSFLALSYISRDLKRIIGTYEASIKTQHVTEPFDDIEVIRPAIERVHCFSMKSTNFSIADFQDKVETHLHAEIISPSNVLNEEIQEFKEFFL
jgi:hypothetical protein